MPKPKSSTLANIAAKLTSFVESDEWYADKAQEIDALEGQLKKLHTALETYVGGRQAGGEGIVEGKRQGCARPFCSPCTTFAFSPTHTVSSSDART